MSITDELREWWVRKFPIMDTKLNKDFTAIADRIDAEHARAEQDLIDANNQMEQLCECSVELPKDADGEYIHIGDVMESVVLPSTCRDVTGVGAECFYAWETGCGRYSQFSADLYRHHHAPTVEDVLTEFAIDWEYESDCEDRAALLKEYAKRLVLAEREGV